MKRSTKVPKLPMCVRNVGTYSHQSLHCVRTNNAKVVRSLGATAQVKAKIAE